MSLPCALLNICGMKEEGSYYICSFIICGRLVDSRGSNGGLPKLYQKAMVLLQMIVEFVLVGHMLFSSFYIPIGK